MALTEQEIFAKASPATAAAIATPPETPTPPVQTPAPTPAAIPTTPEATAPVTPEPAPAAIPDTLDFKFSPGEVPTPAPTTPAWNPKEVIGIDIAPEEVLNRVKSYESVVAERDALKSKNPYANDYVKNLNEAIAQGVSREAFDRVYSADPDKLTPLEKVVLQLKWDKGLNDEDAKLIAEEKYHLGLHEEETMSDSEKASVNRMKSLGNALLNADSKEADKFIRDYKAKSLTPPVQLASDHVDKAWTPVVTDIAKNYQTLQIGKDINITTSNEELAAIEKEVLDAFRTSSAMDVDPNSARGKEIVNAMISETWKARNFDRAIRQIHGTYEVKYANLLLQYKSNPSSQGKGADIQKGQPEPATSISQSIKNAVAQGY